MVVVVGGRGECGSGLQLLANLIAGEEFAKLLNTAKERGRKKQERGTVLVSLVK